VLEDVGTSGRIPGNLRDCHGGVGKVICTGHTETLCCLLRSGNAVVLDMAILEVRVERLEIDEVRDIRVSRWTMIAFVEVVR
jgi:hypothetical protein